MKVVLGIGNPGPEYADTRHNAGYMVVGRAASLAGASFRRGACRALEARFEYHGRQTLLLKPLTFVNLSGETVRLALKNSAIEAEEDLLVVSDDADLQAGTMRFSLKGSSGGHKGLEDTIRVVGERFGRLRIGIGRDPSVPLRDYVLSPIPASEREIMGEVFEEAAKAVLDWVVFGIQYCQNQYNRKQTERSDS